MNVADNVPLYTNKKYRLALELLNDNVPLMIVKRRLYVKTMIQKGNLQNEIDKKRSNRNIGMYDGKFQQPIRKVVFDAQLDNYEKLCAKCERNPDVHPYGCN
jgi:hypothetical protein